MTCVWRERRRGVGSGLGGAAGVCGSMAHGLLTELQRESKLPPQSPSHCGLVALDTGMQGASCWHGPTSGTPPCPSRPGGPSQAPLSQALPELPLWCGVCVEAQGHHVRLAVGCPLPARPLRTAVWPALWGFSGPWAALVSVGDGVGDGGGAGPVCVLRGQFSWQAPHALHCAHEALSSPAGGFLRGDRAFL